MRPPTAPRVARLLCGLVSRLSEAAGTTAPHGTRVRLAGQIDSHNGDRIARQLRAALRHTNGTLEVDMSEVGHLSRAGASAVLSAVAAARTQGVAVVVLGAPPQARSAMRQVGLDHLLLHAAPDPAPGPESGQRNRGKGSSGPAGRR